MSDTLYTPLKLAETTDSSLPPNGFQKLQAKPDGNLYVVNSSGTEYKISGASSSSSSSNYVPTLMTSDFVIPLNTQVLFSEEIDCDNYEIQIDGILTEVN